MSRLSRVLIAWVVGAFSCGGALASPAFVFHGPGTQTFGEPAGVTMREPETPREGERPTLWVKVGPSFTYDKVAIYYTTDGSNPEGERGAPLTPSTRVLRSFAAAGDVQRIFFVRNEPGQSGNDDWWRADFPADVQPAYGSVVKYRVSAWSDQSTDVFAAGGSSFSWTSKLPWPGAGFGAGNPAIGYPPVHFWKEEGVAGNNYINVMIDQNGSLYDVYYPSAGAVQGMATKNEGYDDGNRDEFPSCLTPEKRGQMNINFGTLGLRVDGVTYWASNQSGTAYTGVDQAYDGDSNVLMSVSTLTAGGNNIGLTQYDFTPKGTAFPSDDGGAPNRGLYFKRVLLTNNQNVPKTVDVYYFVDWALNGGDGFDDTFTDTSRGAMVAFDNTSRVVNNGNGCGGEYNPTTFGSYSKSVSVFLAASMKVLPTAGAGGGTFASDFWSDTSSDQGLGWVGSRVTLAPGETREVNIALVGGFDTFPNAAAGVNVGTYGFQMDNALDWFGAQNLSQLQAQTQTYWENWLASGTGFNSPDARVNEVFKRGLLGTALHLDGKNGGIIAGMHNGAYPYVWPRDAAWAAITLARTGFTDEAREIFRFLRDIAYRDVEGWGRKGFWKQKYSTDGYTIWGTPQVDETSCYPWGVRYIYDVTGDLSFLQAHYDEVFEAALASSQDSTIDSRLRYEEGVSLVYSMNLWEDSFDVFNYSNASVIRGLEDAAAIADILNNTSCPGGPNNCGYHTDRDLFNSRASAIRGGLDARLDWNGENSDISQIGIVYPMNVYPAGHPRAELVMDRMNGVAADRFGNFKPLVNFVGGVPEWVGLINRYWGDGYWNGGPWFLTTLWYGAYYALRQDLSPGTADIDNFKYRLDRTIDNLGPVGLGAEQMTRDATSVYPNFRLQTAYPNAWESMSFLVDSVMLFLDWTPDADANVLRVKPKLPSAWSFAEFKRLEMGTHNVDVRVDVLPDGVVHTFTNTTGQPLNVDTTLRVAAGAPVCAVTLNGGSTGSTFNAAANSVRVQQALATGAGARTVIAALSRLPGDVSRNGSVDFSDVTSVLANFGAVGIPYAGADANGDGVVTFSDVTGILAAFGATCP